MSIPFTDLIHPHPSFYIHLSSSVVHFSLLVTSFYYGLWKLSFNSHYHKCISECLSPSLSLSPNFNVKIVSVVNFSPQHPGLFLIERELSALFVPHCNFQFFASFSPQNPTPLKFMWLDWLHQCLQHFITPAVTFHITRFFF